MPTIDVDALLDHARRLRRTPERLLHPRRRARALERLRALRPRSAVVVCKGNICRSPFGEHYLKALVEDGPHEFEVTSAGFLNPGEPSPPDAVAVAAEFDVDLGEHRAATLAPDRMGAFDMVLVMEAWQARRLRTTHGVPEERIFLLGDFDPGDIGMRTIQDPVCRGRSSFRACYRRMAACLRLLADNLGGGRLPGGAPDDPLLDARRASAG